MTFIRRDIHVISSGQMPPFVSEIMAHMVGVLINPLAPAWTMAIIAVVVLVCLYFALRQGFFLVVPLLWIALTYAMLILLALFADGPIKWLHIHHAVYAFILLMVAGAAAAPRSSRHCRSCRHRQHERTAAVLQPA